MTNKVNCKVEKIRSYQTLIGRNRAGRTWQKPEYKAYQQELALSIRKLTPIQAGKPFRATLTFNIKESVVLPTYYVKMLTSGNTSRKFNTELEAKEYMNVDKHYIEFEDFEIKYGVGDEDNLTKPIYDTLTLLGIIEDDMYIKQSHKYYTFNNDENSIDIELEELEIKINEKGVYYFE